MSHIFIHENRNKKRIAHTNESADTFKSNKTLLKRNFHLIEALVNRKNTHVNRGCRGKGEGEGAA